MTRPNENPLVPESWQAGGSKGAEAKALGPSATQDTAQAMTAHNLARLAIDAARERVAALALATDDPLPGMVEAADFLDAAADSLMRSSEFSDDTKDTEGGTA